MSKTVSLSLQLDCRLHLVQIVPQLAAIESMQPLRFLDQDIHQALAEVT